MGRDPGSEPTSVLAAAQSGDRRQALEALRDQLAAAADVVEPSVLAQVAGQLRQVLTDIASLVDADAGGVIDEFAARRDRRASDRGAASAAVERAPRRKSG